MKYFPSFQFLFLLVAAPGLTNCDHATVDNVKPGTAESATGTGLEGSWKLIDRQCYCAPAPTPNETAVFTSTSYSFFTSGQLATRGTYASQPIKTCNAPTTGLRFTEAVLANGTHDAIFTLRNDTLVLDYGSPCDAPRNTYRRLP